jgi:hypothetical protein
LITAQCPASSISAILRERTSLIIKKNNNNYLVPMGQVVSEED